MFVNTIDKYGDQVTSEMLITRTIDEYRDDAVTRLEKHVFDNCPALTVVDVPNVTYIGRSTFRYCTSLLAVILRNAVTVCTLASVNWANSFEKTPIASGTGYIYVPRALVDSYKAATNWSTYAAQFRALEDYTVDGTITGMFAAGIITYKLTGFSSSNSETYVLNSSYQTTLTPYGDNASVNITMNGVDITTEVYNAVTGEVNIPKVAGDVVITASCDALIIGYEVGGISYTTGAEESTATRFRTESIPFDPSVNKFRADVVVNGNTNAKARLLVRPFRADGTFISTTFTNIISPAATNNWAISGTEYTFNPGSECAYVRIVFADATDTNASTLTGTIIVSGVTYELVKE